MERLYGKAMMRPCDLSPSMVCASGNTVKYYSLERTIERLHTLLSVMVKLYCHTVTSYGLRQAMTQLATRNHVLTRFGTELP